ncbi:hypothetical protein KMZ32_06235 [Phycicoccus sp. MAQZ13P-2]|uniref:hypothetical protein n=1 Tax=Phycicoccus mangrovi TaxID=2840470 RepID=UPI001BFFF299|nr:hypothetical protein [Phycicoccus mangrovi]MBT9257724.1 hypothetical protein [Phycicoccus mangrovi]MBT9273670.1 hypothetical protein [Phycicoccus mangrovi]
MARLDDSGLRALAGALGRPEVVQRYRSKVVEVDGSGCWWWTGALSGRGHGRFWLGPQRVVIAHRFGYALVHGVQAVAAVPVLGHRCDNPLCQRVGPGHVVASSYVENRREWAIRKAISGSPLDDPRGSRARARELRDLARQDPALVAADLERLRALYGEQMALW